MELNKYIDHTLLKANATQSQIQQICEEAKEYKFASVCVNSCWVKYCAKQLEGTGVNVCAVVGFPLGAMTTRAKAYEAACVIEDGGKEVDMVINVGALKDKNYDLVLEDIKAVVEAAKGNCVKVIIEACLLTKEEIVKACELSLEANATFVKTSTGFSTGGATAEDVKLMKDTVKDNAKVKASGGVRTKEDAIQMIEAGAERIGASASISIVK